jgi:magnesium chelatase subunit H
MLTYPETWGPTEWGPIPFLPDNDILVQRMEKQWGELRGYRWGERGGEGGEDEGVSLCVRGRWREVGGTPLFHSHPRTPLPPPTPPRGMSTTATGNLLVSGLQSGNIFVGVQPALGIEGDPMRLLFERDLTPHPQYAAFYK